MSETATSFALEQLQPSAPPAHDAHEQLIAQATAEAESIRELARSEGRREGCAEGRREALAEISIAALALGEAIQGVERLREELSAELERDAVELAFALTAQILAGALDAEPERVVDVVRGALRRIAERRRITILVDPKDLEIVSGAIGELRAQTGGIELCEIQSDRRIGRGGAIVRTAEGEVDLSIDTQLERAREIVQAELQSEAGQPR